MFVLDCSVALAWSLHDEESEYADQVLELLVEQKAIVPPLWNLEVMNVLLMAEKRGRVAAAKMPLILKTMAELNVETDKRAISIADNDFLLFAQEYAVTSYDAAYLYLAQRENLRLATLDKKMRKVSESLGCYLEIRG